MSRLEEVDAKLRICRNAIDRGHLARTLAAEVDELQEEVKRLDWKREENKAFAILYRKALGDARTELARVKAESLRVVRIGEACDILAAKSQYVTDEDGELWECHPEPADDGREVRSVLTGCGGYFADTIVQPVRLERWKDE